MSDVSDKLQESRGAHTRARPIIANKRQVRGWDLESLRAAYDARLAAQGLDPDHADPEWSNEQSFADPSVDAHDALLQFYREKLGIPA